MKDRPYYTVMSMTQLDRHQIVTSAFRPYISGLNASEARETVNPREVRDAQDPGARNARTIAQSSKQ